MDLALRVLFHRFQIIFDRIRLTFFVAIGTIKINIKCITAVSTVNISKPRRSCSWTYQIKKTAAATKFFNNTSANTRCSRRRQNFVLHGAESFAQRECDVITARPIESPKNPKSFRQCSQDTHEISKRSPSSNAISFSKDELVSSAFCFLLAILHSVSMECLTSHLNFLDKSGISIGIPRGYIV